MSKKKKNYSLEKKWGSAIKTLESQPFSYPDSISTYMSGYPGYGIGQAYPPVPGMQGQPMAQETNPGLANVPNLGNDAAVSGATKQVAEAIPAMEANQHQVTEQETAVVAEEPVVTPQDQAVSEEQITEPNPQLSTQAEETTEPLATEARLNDGVGEKTELPLASEQVTAVVAEESVVTPQDQAVSEEQVPETTPDLSTQAEETTEPLATEARPNDGVGEKTELPQASEQDTTVVAEEPVVTPQDQAVSEEQVLKPTPDLNTQAEATTEPLATEASHTDGVGEKTELPQASEQEIVVIRKVQTRREKTVAAPKHENQVGGSRKRGPKNQISAGLSKLSAEELQAIGWRPMEERRKAKVLPIGQRWIKTANLLRAVNGIYGTNLTYDALVYYINEFFGNYLNPSKPDNSSEGLHNKPEKIKYKLGWQEPAERIETVSAYINQDLEIVLAKIKLDHKLNARSIFYDALVFYTNKFYKEFVEK